MNTKKFIASFLVVAMVGTSGSAFASQSLDNPQNRSEAGGVIQVNSVPQNEYQDWSTSNEVVLDNQVIGTRTTNFDYDRVVKGEATTVKLITTTTYQFNEKATEQQKEVLQNSTNVYDVYVDEDTTSLAVNGVEVPEEMLDQEVSFAPSLSNSASNQMGVSRAAAATDRGGVPAVSHYYGNYETYAFGSYSGISFWTFGPKGDNVQKQGIDIGNKYFMPAKTAIDSFAANLTETNRATYVLGSELGFAVVTFSTVIGALAAGGAAAITAGQISDYWNATQNNLTAAYNYIKKM
ncbi:hypothetical protein [Paenibacillus sp. FSL K6-1558]|uniref:hypothetical protein n=1 Tax=Paenibacillus sp. FSL K6-1558 TaxID=2921473 RepID=UPI0030FAE917